MTLPAARPLRYKPDLIEASCSRVIAMAAIAVMTEVFVCEELHVELLLGVKENPPRGTPLTQMNTNNTSVLKIIVIFKPTAKNSAYLIHLSISHRTQQPLHKLPQTSTTSTCRQKDPNRTTNKKSTTRQCERQRMCSMAIKRFPCARLVMRVTCAAQDRRSAPTAIGISVCSVNDVQTAVMM